VKSVASEYVGLTAGRSFRKNKPWRLKRPFLLSNSSVESTFEFHPSPESHGVLRQEKSRLWCGFPYIAPLHFIRVHPFNYSGQNS
jgi:hypothetical protein